MWLEHFVRLVCNHPTTTMANIAEEIRLQQEQDRAHMQQQYDQLRAQHDENVRLLQQERERILAQEQELARLQQQQPQQQQPQPPQQQQGGQAAAEGQEADEDDNFATERHHDDWAIRDDEKEERIQTDRDIKEADLLVSDIAKCDGASPEAVRLWLKRVGQTQSYTQQTVRVATRTATGALLDEIEAYLNSHNREATWDELRKDIVAHFLPPEEEDYLCAQVDQIKQKPYEAVGAYGRRFKKAVNLAYPGHKGEDYGALGNRLLKKTFMDGLSDHGIIERLLKEARPRTYDDALRSAIRYEADEQNVKAQFTSHHMPVRHEEPMEVGAVGGRPSRPRQEQPSQQDEFQDMKRQVCGLTKQVTQLIAALNNGSADIRPAQTRPATTNRPTRTHSDGDVHTYTAEGRPICSYCQKAGHIRAACRKRKGDERRNQGGQ